MKKIKPSEMRYLSLSIMVIILSGCGTTRIVTQRDTTIINTVTTYRDTLYQIEIQKEEVHTYAKDTAKAETTYAEAMAYQDTSTSLIVLKLRNKDFVPPIKLRIPVTATTTYKSKVDIIEPASHTNAQYIKWWHILLSSLISLLFGFILGKILRF
jgi:uncharacterized protein YceK